MELQKVTERTKQILEERGAAGLQNILDFFNRIKAEVEIAEEFNVPIFSTGSRVYVFEELMMIHQTCFEQLASIDEVAGNKAKEVHNFWRNHEAMIKEFYAMK